MQKLNRENIVAMIRTRGSLEGYNMHNPWVVIVGKWLPLGPFTVARWDGESRSWQSANYGIETFEEAMAVASKRGEWS